MVDQNKTVEGPTSTSPSSKELYNTKIENKPLLVEFKCLISIAIPTVAVQFFIYAIFTLIASYIGLHLGTKELASFSLASLTANLTCLSVIIGSLSASEILSPRAFGMNQYEEVGRLAIRGFIVTAIILIPIMIPLLFYMYPILCALGQDPIVAKLASKWIRVYVIGVPFTLLFRVVQRFLAAQNIVAPMVYGAFITCVLITPPLIRYFVARLGFLGSAVSLILAQMAAICIPLIYLMYVRPHHPQTWLGIAPLWKESIRVGPMLHFLRLSTGGVSSYTEWWFWETICFIAGKFGVVPLVVHSIGYQLIPLAYMIILGISIGTTVRMGALLSKNVEKVKSLVAAVLIFTFVIALCVTFTAYMLRDVIIGFFTKDDEVIEGCIKIWPYLCLHIFLLYFFCVNSGITRALGQQWRLGGIIVASLWVVTLPAIHYFAVIKGGGLYTMWKIVPMGYLFLNINLFINYIFLTDWDKVGEKIAGRNSEAPGLANETTLLLDSDHTNHMRIDV